MQWSEKLSKQTALTCTRNSYKIIILEIVGTVSYPTMESLVSTLLYRV